MPNTNNGDQEEATDSGVRRAIDRAFARRDETERPEMPYLAPKRAGASASVDCDIWSADFRQRLDPSDPAAISPTGVSYERTVTSFEALHGAAVRLVPAAAIVPASQPQR